MNTPPFSHSYNLNRLAQAGDEVAILPDAEALAALARFAEVLRVENFTGKVQLHKLAANRFRLDFQLEADIVQACVASLAEVPAHIAQNFTRELHFSPPLKRAPEEAGITDVSLEDDKPEEIDSLHYDLAAPLIEEFILAIDPYPRAPGVAFQAPSGPDEGRPDPFAVLKGLKSGL